MKGSLTKKLKSQKIFLVSDPFKKWFYNPEIENLPLTFLLIYKKFFVSGLSDHFLEGSLTKKLKSQNFFYSYDPFKKWPVRPEIQNFPLMSLLIYKKKICPGHLEQQLNVFILLVKSDLGRDCPAHKGYPQTKNIVGGQPHPWVGQTTQVW